MQLSSRPMRWQLLVPRQHPDVPHPHERLLQVSNPRQEDVESLVKLVRTIGGTLEESGVRLSLPAISSPQLLQPVLQTACWTCTCTRPCKCAIGGVPSEESSL
jgi:hypothetical protein